MLKEIRRLRALVQEEKKRREKDVAALWSAIRRISVEQSVSLPQAHLENFEESDGNLFSDPAGNQHDRQIGMTSAPASPARPTSPSNSLSSSSVSSSSSIFSSSNTNFPSSNNSSCPIGFPGSCDPGDQALVANPARPTSPTDSTSVSSRSSSSSSNANSPSSNNPSCPIGFPGSCDPGSPAQVANPARPTSPTDSTSSVSSRSSSSSSSNANSPNSSNPSCPIVFPGSCDPGSPAQVANPARPTSPTDSTSSVSSRSSSSSSSSANSPSSSEHSCPIVFSGSCDTGSPAQVANPARPTSPTDSTSSVSSRSSSYSSSNTNCPSSSDPSCPIGFPGSCDPSGPAQVAEAGPDMMFAPLPFFDVIAELLPPAVCDGNRVEEFTFRLSPDQVRQLTALRFGSGGDEQPFQIQLRLSSVGPGYDSLLVCYAVFVNNQHCHLPWAGSAGSPRPISITRLCRLDSDQTNTVRVTTSGCSAVIQLVRRRGTPQLLEQLERRTPQPASLTRTLVKQKLGGGDEDGIAITSLRCSLQCPLGLCRIQLPCRASTCRHLQCFDAASYIAVNERKTTWQCPVCDKQAKFEDLVIDSYFCEVLARTDVSCREVALHPDGSWRPASDEDKENHAPHKTAVQYQTLDLEDDTGTDEAPPADPEPKRPRLLRESDTAERVPTATRSQPLADTKAAVFSAPASASASAASAFARACFELERSFFVGESLLRGGGASGGPAASAWKQTTLPSMSCMRTTTPYRPAALTTDGGRAPGGATARRRATRPRPAVVVGRRRSSRSDEPEVITLD